MALSVKLKKPRHPWPVRLLHWTYVPALFLNALSGFYVTRPSRRFGFSSMRSALKVHAIAQYVLLFAYVARVYYGHVTKDYKKLLPNRKDLADAPEYLKYELFLTKKEPKYPKYNPLQKLVFAALGALVPLQGVTGLALYAPKVFSKPATVAGGLNPLRRMHYLTALAITSLSIGHLYLVLTHDLKKVKSIFTGHE
jgi:Ni/Fe-hydrogenase 1 B-type cytochrome subunit